MVRIMIQRLQCNVFMLSYRGYAFPDQVLEFLRHSIFHFVYISMVIAVFLLLFWVETNASSFPLSKQLWSKWWISFAAWNCKRCSGVVLNSFTLSPNAYRVAYSHVLSLHVFSLGRLLWIIFHRGLTLTHLE